MDTDDKLILARDLENIQNLFNEKKLLACEEKCYEIINKFPNVSSVYFQLGLIAFEKGEFSKIDKLFLRAIELSPDKGIFYRSYGEICRRLNRYDVAIKYSQKATQLMPDDVDAWYGYGLLLRDMENFKEAIIAYQKVAVLFPQHERIYYHLGAAYARIEDNQKAIMFYKKSLEVNLHDADSYNGLGTIYMMCGDLVRAEKYFVKAIDCRHDFIEAHMHLSSIKSYKANDPHLAALKKMVENKKDHDGKSAAKCAFAVGKIYEDIGDYDQAMASFHQANSLMRSTFDYNVDQIENFVDRMIKRFDRSSLEKMAIGYQDETPVFVVGMPRSGTTLVEQIISSHRDVCGAGEVDYFPVLAQSIECGDKNGAVLSDQSISDLSAKQIEEMGMAYIKKLRFHDSKAKLITDKMTSNFFFIGLISRVLPQAKIIHVRRHPMDICLSNYCHLFNPGTMLFSYTFKELARYYKAYEKIMTHWHAVLPKGKILDVCYEDVVQDIEKKTREILAYCQLDWDEKCLAFYKNKRQVKTVSIAQVRQPVYTKSVQKWHRYKKYLSELEADLVS